MKKKRKHSSSLTKRRNHIPSTIPFIIIVIALILGMGAALFLLYEHLVPSASKYCTFGESFDCGIVSKSPYATVDGISYLMTIDWGWNIPLIDLGQSGALVELLISNAFLGFLTLLLILLLTITYYRNQTLLRIKPPLQLIILKVLTAFSVLYGLYLFYIQHSILKTYCIFCISMDIVIIITFITTWFFLAQKEVKQ